MSSGSGVLTFFFPFIIIIIFSLLKLTEKESFDLSLVGQLLGAMNGNQVARVQT